MRISDWSSDVCSSDLRGILSRQTRRTDKLASAGLRRPELQKLDRVEVLHAAAEALGGIKQYVGLGGIGIAQHLQAGRSQERRVGQDCVSNCRTWCSPSH